MTHPSQSTEIVSHYTSIKCRVLTMALNFLVILSLTPSQHHLTTLFLPNFLIIFQTSQEHSDLTPLPFYSIGLELSYLSLPIICLSWSFLPIIETFPWLLSKIAFCLSCPTTLHPLPFFIFQMAKALVFKEDVRKNKRSWRK